jgi:hypothetical protein
MMREQVDSEKYLYKQELQRDFVGMECKWR